MPAVQTVGSPLKPTSLRVRHYPKEHSNHHYNHNGWELRECIYITLTPPTEGTLFFDTKTASLVIFTLIGGVVAGTTPVTIVRNCYFHSDANEYQTPSGRVYCD